MKNVLLTIEYDGSQFHGWQRQNGLLTVQGLLEQVISSIVGQPVEVEGTGRTDAGVHALGQCATFKSQLKIPVERLANVINNGIAKATESINRPGPVRIIEAREVNQDFHARFSAVGKTYRYRLSLGEPDVFQRNYVYQIKDELDLDLMVQAAKLMEGTRDFACFQSTGGTPRKTTVRTVYKVEVVNSKPYVDILVTGNGFLYNMVRIMVGTLVDVASGKLDMRKLEEALKYADRTKAGHTAPPFGLAMEKVYFNQEELNLCCNLKDKE